MYLPLLWGGYVGVLLSDDSYTGWQVNETLRVESVQLYNISQFEGTKKFKFIVMQLLLVYCVGLLSSIVVVILSLKISPNSGSSLVYLWPGLRKGGL